MKSEPEAGKLQAWEDERGGALIETALVLPPFFLLLFGLFNFSTILFGYCNATYAARVGARIASVNSSTSMQPCNSASIQTLVSSFLYAAPSTGVTITTTWTPGNTIGSTVKVAVRIVYPINIPFFATLTQVTVGSTAQRTVMR